MERYAIDTYTDLNGMQPFQAWFRSLDRAVQARIEARIIRLRNGNFGDSRHLERGLHEARCHFGSGYRIYFGMHREKLILLLGGGDKASQVEDIFAALQHWSRYKEAGS